MGLDTLIRETQSIDLAGNTPGKDQPDNQYRKLGANYETSILAGWQPIFAYQGHKGTECVLGW